MKSMFVLLVGAIVFSSCSTDSSFEQLKAVNNALERSNEVIAYSTKMARMAIDANRDYAALEKRRTLLPKIDSLSRKTAEVVKFITSLKASMGNGEKDKHIVNEIFETNNKGLELYKMLAVYGHNVKVSFLEKEQLDIYKLTENSHVLYRFELGNEDASKMWVKLNFQDASAASVRTMLSTLQNDVLMIEHRLMEEFKSQTAVLTHDYGILFKALAIVSSTQVKPGEELVVDAGIGEFSISAKPEIIINGVKTTPDVDGVVSYKLNADPHPGEHAIKVLFRFTGPDGAARTMEKEIRYTVVK